MNLAVTDMAVRDGERLERTRHYLSEQDVVLAKESAQLAHRLLDEILSKIVPGVRESEIKEYALSCFASNGIEKTWHPPYVRFAEHTLLTFQDKAKEDLTLRENDIAFVDIGVVKQGIEGDAGRTVVVGKENLFVSLQGASEQIFRDARDFWKSANPTGIVLYEFIHACAKKLGVIFSLDPAGHLIGSHPHRGWKRGINHYPEKIEAGKWILEIQIRHPELSYGAFYEDLLY